MNNSQYQEAGFTLLELLTVVALMAVGVAFSLPNLASFRQSQELNSATKNAVGWLDDLRRQSIQNSLTCTATWDADAVGAEAVGQCGAQPASTLDVNSTTTKVVEITTANGSETWTFTPRGTATDSREVIFTLKDESTNPGRCIKLVAPLGLIRAGKRSSSNNGFICDYTNSF